MDDELKTFLTELAGSVDKLSDFIADPKATAEAAGLSEESRDVLFSGDQNRIYVAIGGIQLTPPGQEGEEAPAAEQPAAAAMPQVHPQFVVAAIDPGAQQYPPQMYGQQSPYAYGQQPYFPTHPTYPTYPMVMIVMPYFPSPWGGYVR
jgi:hypothetical protein